MAIYTIGVAARTDCGRCRSENQDAILAEIVTNKPLGMFAVADGMGGPGGGQVASNLVIETLREELQPLLAAIQMGTALANETIAITLTSQVHEIVTHCNGRILEHSKKHPETYGLGTTLTFALVIGNLAVIGNIGDSRVYRVRNSEIKLLTHDHSIVAQLVSTGLIGADDIYTHPQRNYIYRNLGGEVEAQPDVFAEQLQVGDILLLCSDGLWSMVRDDAILRTVSTLDTLDVVSAHLVQLANDNGGDDNISVVVVQVK